MSDALVIGAGPAGLMAAEILSAAGLPVSMADAMPSPGRKLLMAGKSGLNLTKDEGIDAFLAAFTPCPPPLAAALRAFGPAQVMDWARGLGQPVFTGTSGRVFPVAMKASPLLRAWLARLGGAGVTLRPRWRWQGFQGARSVFATPEGRQVLAPAITILAMGGASWSRLGSDGAWAAALPGQVTPFRPANMGFAVNWSAHMAPHLGRPVKTVALIAGGRRERGEFVISARGIEGGGVYAVSRAVRDGAALTIDLMPDLDLGALRARLARAGAAASLASRLRKAGLDPVKSALVQEWGRPLPADLAPLLKALPVRHRGPRPLDEAISAAGGLRWDALDGFAMRSHPGVCAAGEMLDWEAPTGGYLISGCLATGRAAALQALGRPVR